MAISGGATPAGTVRALVVEDERHARRDLCYLLDSRPGVVVVGEAATVAEAREQLRERQIDVVFLDVQLRGGSGFDLVGDVGTETMIVFVTAHEKYAVRAFEVNAIDYLVKPVAEQHLTRALERVRAIRDGGDPYRERRSMGLSERIYFKTDRSHRVVSLAEVLAITSVGGNYTSVLLLDGSDPAVRKPFKEWERMLPDDQFVRIHRSTIVNVDHITVLQRDREGAYAIALTGRSELLPVSRRLAPGVKQRMQSITVGGQRSS